MTNLIVGKEYVVRRKIKLHTKPLIEATLIDCGKYVKQTSKSYVFDNFRVSKNTLISAVDSAVVCDELLEV